jgi:hypothetical protein
MGEGRHLMLFQINSFVLSTTGGASVTSQRLAGEPLETHRDNTTSNTPISSLFCQHQIDDYYARLQERGHPAVWGHTPRPYRMWSGRSHHGRHGYALAEYPTGRIIHPQTYGGRLLHEQTEQQRGFKFSARIGTLKYPGDVGHRGTINALVSSEIAEPMFNQTEGCGQRYGPENSL